MFVGKELWDHFLSAEARHLGHVDDEHSPTTPFLQPIGPQDWGPILKPTGGK